MATNNRWMSDILGKVTQKVKEYTDSDFHTFIVVNGERIPFSIDNISFSKMDTNDPEMELHIGSKEGKEECSMGNAAAMREALTKVKEWLEHRIRTCGFEFSATFPTILEDVVLPALAAPPRNCDVGTEDEQIERWQAFCDKYEEGCTGCPCDDRNTFCFAIWAQIPYEGGSK